MNGTVERNTGEEVTELLDELDTIIARIRQLADQMKEEPDDE